MHRSPQSEEMDGRVLSAIMTHALQDASSAQANTFCIVLVPSGGGDGRAHAERHHCRRAPRVPLRGGGPGGAADREAQRGPVPDDSHGTVQRLAAGALFKFV